MARSEIDVSIINGLILVMDEQMRMIEKGYVLIKDSEIVEIDSMDNFPSPKIEAKEEIDAKGCIVLPGFVNAHSHFAMTLFRGLADDLSLNDWLQNYIWPIESKLKGKDCFIGTQLAAIEMIQGGITAACDMYYFEEEVMAALEEVGFRGVLGRVMLDFDDENRSQKELKDTEKLIEHITKNAKLCIPIVSPHAPYSCSSELLIKSREQAEKYQLPLQVHLSETKNEVDEFKKKMGKSPVEYLDKIGFLCDRLVAAHCVWLDENDCKLLNKNKVKIAHNPSSNMKLGSGIMPYKMITKHGITVALGTDGAASNNALSMIKELRMASYCHKGVNTDPTILPAREAIKMATSNGAKALGLADKIGSLEPGKKADIAILDFNKPNTWPPHNPYSLITYSARDANVRTTIINGQIVMRDRKFTTVDISKVMADAQEAIIELGETTTNLSKS